MAVVNVCWIWFYRKGFLSFNWLGGSVKIHVCHEFIYIDNWLINFITVESNFFFLGDLMQWKSWIGWITKSQKFHLQLKYVGRKLLFQLESRASYFILFFFFTSWWEILCTSVNLEQFWSEQNYSGFVLVLLKSKYGRRSKMVLLWHSTAWTMTIFRM